MSETMIVQMIHGNRFFKDGTLFKRQDRAYRVTEDYGFELIDITDNDRPKFAQTREDRLADDTHIIDLTKGQVDDGEEVVVREVGGKIISRKPKSGKKIGSKKDKKAKEKKGLKLKSKKPDSDIDEV